MHTQNVFKEVCEWSSALHCGATVRLVLCCSFTLCPLFFRAGSILSRMRNFPEVWTSCSSICKREDATQDWVREQLRQLHRTSLTCYCQDTLALNTPGPDLFSKTPPKKNPHKFSISLKLQSLPDFDNLPLKDPVYFSSLNILRSKWLRTACKVTEGLHMKFNARPLIQLSLCTIT